MNLVDAKNVLIVCALSELDIEGVLLGRCTLGHHCSSDCDEMVTRSGEVVDGSDSVFVSSRFRD